MSKLSKCASTVQAAIAYVSSAENLHLHAGDTLITDASENAIKAGQTSARVLREFFRRGVVVYHCAGLHAKLLFMEGRLWLAHKTADWFKEYVGRAGPERLIAH